MEYELEEGLPIWVGRSSKMDFSVPHETISSRHFQITWRRSKFEIVNQSQYGVYVGDDLVERTMVRSGQTFVAGEIEFRVMEMGSLDETLPAEGVRLGPSSEATHDAGSTASLSGTRQEQGHVGREWIRRTPIMVAAILLFGLVIGVAVMKVVLTREPSGVSARENDSTDFTDDAWSMVEVYCGSPEDCAMKARESMRLAEELYDSRGLADRHLFDGVRAAAGALAYLGRVDKDLPPGLYGEAVKLREKVGATMNDEVKELVFEFRRSLRTKDFGRAKSLVERLRHMFPDREARGYVWSRNMQRVLERCRNQGGEACFR